MEVDLKVFPYLLIHILYAAVVLKFWIELASYMHIAHGKRNDVAKEKQKNELNLKIISGNCKQSSFCYGF